MKTLPLCQTQEHRVHHPLEEKRKLKTKKNCLNFNIQHQVETIRFFGKEKESCGGWWTNVSRNQGLDPRRHGVASRWLKLEKCLEEKVKAGVEGHPTPAQRCEKHTSLQKRPEWRRFGLELKKAPVLPQIPISCSPDGQKQNKKLNKRAILTLGHDLLKQKACKSDHYNFRPKLKDKKKNLHFRLLQQESYRHTRTRPKKKAKSLQFRSLQQES